MKTEETIWIQIPMLTLHLDVNLFLSILLQSLHVGCPRTSITSHLNSNVSSDWNLAIQETRIKSPAMSLSSTYCSSAKPKLSPLYGQMIGIAFASFHLRL